MGEPEVKIFYETRESAFSRRVDTFALVNIEHVDLEEFLAECFQYFEETIRDILVRNTTVKVNLILSVVFEKSVHTEDEVKYVKETLHIHTRNRIIDARTDLYKFFNETVVEYILQKIDEAIIQGSGFSLSEIDELIVQVNKYNPLNGSSYIPLPNFLKWKKAIVNVENADDQCFKWAILSAMFPATTNQNRVSSYKRYADENLLNFSGIKFPMNIGDISKFEKLNPLISVNLYGFNPKSKKIYPLRLTTTVKQFHIHLLYLKKIETRNDIDADADADDDTDDDLENNIHNTVVTGHYCWIKCLSRLLRSQITTHQAKLFFCDRCLNSFFSLDKLTNHRTYCDNQNDCSIQMPMKSNNKLKFINIRNQLDVPFIIYADVEALLKKPTQLFSKTESTTAYQEHEVYSIGFYFKSLHPKKKKSYYKSERGPDCITKFMKHLKSISDEIAAILDEVEPMRLSAAEEESFQNAEICHICKGGYTETNNKVRDHSHLSGKFRGSAHSKCNLQYQESRTIPVVFHNLSHYDSHFLLRKLANSFDGDIRIIPINAENYISFTKTVNDSSDDFKTKIKFKFMDSFRFMNSSLDHLSSLLPAEEKKILHSEYNHLSTDRLKLLERKGVFCYDYIDSWEKLLETQLPSKELFYSKLTDENLSDDEYNFAIQVWNTFDIENIGEYSDLYLKTDVLLLADVFENFRETCRRIYGLDPAHYYTSPGLSFDAMLSYTKVEIELLTDIDQLLFVENGNLLIKHICSIFFL